jgi:DNA-binding transcriptional LysR family regulator
MPDARQIRHFLAVVDTGTISAAAAKVGLTQQALSKSLAALEARLNAKLVERTSRGVVLTPAGLALVEQAKQSVRAFDRLHELAASLSKNAVSRVRIGLSPAVECGPASEALGHFAVANPLVDLTVSTGVGVDFAASILNGRLDFAIALAVEPVEPSVNARKIGEAQWVVAGREGHPLLSEARSLSDLAGGRWIIDRRRDALHTRFRDDLEAAGVELAPVGVSTLSITVATRMMRSADFMTIVPKPMVDCAHGVIHRDLAPSPWCSDICVYTHHPLTPGALADRLRAALETAMAQAG